MKIIIECKDCKHDHDWTEGVFPFCSKGGERADGCIYFEPNEEYVKIVQNMKKFIESQIDISDDFVKVIKDHFWELL